ncbi:MAG TPA: LacI family DNA-binding transcriptional regulator [Propionibacteriaceae bacterium]
MTIFDVARLAGVSHQTVSRVLNEHPNVRDTTRARVEEAVRQLHYRPNVAARVMASRRSRNIGLITAGSTDYGPASTVLGFTSAARSARYAVTISTVVDIEPASLRASVDLLLGQQVEAIVVVASRVGVVSALAGIEFDTPVIAVESTGLAPLPSVSIDQYAGARLVTEHLIGLGHRDIVHLAGPSDSLDATERLRGWRDTMADHGLVAHPPWPGDWSPASGYRLGRAGVASGPAFTAIFSANDQMALGCLHALREDGLQVPDQVSVVGFDDIPEAEHFCPPLTTMRQDFHQLGEDIMALVLTTLAADGSGPTTRHVPELIVRESSGPAPG